MKNKKSNLYEKNDVSRTCHVIGNVFLQLWNNKYQNTTLYRSEARNTVLKAGEIFQTVLHRKSDMYYLDPVLYQPEGVKDGNYIPELAEEVIEVQEDKKVIK